MLRTFTDKRLLISACFKKIAASLALGHTCSAYQL